MGLATVVQQKKFVLMPPLISTANSAQLILSLLLMAAQSFATISKEKSCAHQWKTPTVARTQLSVCKELLIPMDNIAQLTPSAQPTAELMRLLAPTELTQEVSKKPLFAELKEMTEMVSFALEFAHQPVLLMKF